MTSQQIAEQFDFYGSYFDVNVDRDYVYISFCSLSKYFRQTLAVAEQILLHPLFPEEEVASYREKRKQRLRIERMKVETEAREAFARALFGLGRRVGPGGGLGRGPRDGHARGRLKRGRFLARERLFVFLLAGHDDLVKGRLYFLNFGFAAARRAVQRLRAGEYRLAQPVYAGQRFFGQFLRGRAGVFGGRG